MPTTKFIRTKERFYSAHHMLQSCARKAIQSAEKSDWHRPDVLVAMTLSALSIEAIANSVGVLVIPDWESIDNSPVGTKLWILARALNIPYDRNSAPWKEVHELLKFRNSVAHARPERVILEEVLPPEKDMHDTDVPMSRLEKQLTVGAAKRALLCSQSLAALLLERLPTPLRAQLVDDSWTNTFRFSDDA